MTQNVEQKISFIGGGNMAQAIIGGLLSRGVPSTLITVSEPVAQVQAVLKQRDVNVTDDNQQAIADADVVILAVKPQVLADVLLPLKGQFKQQIIISIIAGAPIALMSDLLGGYNKIVRVMPNTPALVQCGANGAYATDSVSLADRNLASQILAATGLVIWVDQERKIDAITALSGSGPAYFFYLMEAMIQAGKSLGLDEKTATALTLQTGLGAAQMAITSEHNPAKLRKNVTSPGGTTQAAIETFDQFQIAQHIQTALAAAEKRSQELAHELAVRIKTPSN